MFERIQVLSATALLLALRAAGDLAAQEPDREVAAAKAFLGGQIQVYYRAGEVLTGTHHLIDVEHDARGRYTLSADTARVTILGNVQRGGWTDKGRWDVIRVGQQVGIRHLSDSGLQGFFPLKVQPNGAVVLLAEGLPGAPASCSLARGWQNSFDIGLGKPASIGLKPR
jgi:hypothetical protein